MSSECLPPGTHPNKRMNIQPVTLEGKRVLLEPLTLAHLPELELIAFDPDLWRNVHTPMVTKADLLTYVEGVLGQQRACTALPWVIRQKSSGRIIGCTRYMDIQPQHRALEIGASWLIREFHGTGTNAEVKYLQLRHAFENLRANRVALKTHHENLRSQAAMRAIGATQEGIFRNHMIMADGSLRHTVWFSIICEDWPPVKHHLEQKMARNSV